MRVHVKWHTTEVIDWEADIEIPDGEDPEFYLHGDSGELVDVEDLVPLAERPMDSFERDIDEVTPIIELRGAQA